MNKIAADIPGLNTVYDFYKSNPLKNQPSQIQTLGDLLSILIDTAFYITAFLAFLYLVWGALVYILAQGKKEELAKARDRITWAIIGLMVVLLAFMIAKFAAEISQPKGELPF